MAYKMINKSIVVVAKERVKNFYTALANEETRVTVVPFINPMHMAQRVNADIVLLDCGHDGEDGLRWLIQFKQSLKNIPVIFITNVKSHDIIMRAYKLGIRDYFTKPVSISEINTLINELHSLKSISRERRTSLPFVPVDNDRKMMNNGVSDVPEKIAHIVNYIDENISKSLRLSDIASQANISKFHFARIFKQLTGFSPLEFAAILKMHRAKKLLHNKNIPISMVAEEVGFYDLRNFDRRFKQYTGLTPSSYRNSLSDNL